MKASKLFLTATLLLLVATAFAQTTQTFTNNSGLTVPSGSPTTTVGNANPYPSTITAASMPGVITKVTVAINGITSTFPDDFDIVLVSPTAQAVTLMSDCGGGDDISGINLVFDAAAGSSLADGTGPGSGTYLPTDYDLTDNYPSPGPGNQSPATALSAFNSNSANGTWSLYVVDDFSQDVHSINSWSVTITTSGSPCQLTIPGNSIDENETCGTHTNDGTCFDAVPYGAISCGQTIAGTVYFNSGSDFDSDEFEFTITDAAVATFTVKTGFNAYVTFLNVSTCQVAGSAEEVAPCTEISHSEVLYPGTYAVFIEPSFTNSPFFGCVSGNAYYVSLTMDPVSPVISAGGPAAFCQGGSVALSSSTATSYVWSPGGETTQSITASASGIYSVDATVNGCTATTSAGVPVAVTPATAVSISGVSGSYCLNSPVVSLVPSAGGGTFSGPGIVNNGSAGSAVMPGTPIAVTDFIPAGVQTFFTPGGIPGTALGTDQFIASACLKISHPFISDLKASVTSPNGTTVVLFDRPGIPASGFGCTGDNIEVTFIPGTGAGIEAVCGTTIPAIFGSYTAFTGHNLASLNDGSDPNGTWKLTVSDNANLNTGTVTAFTLNFGTNGTFNPALAGTGTHTLTYTPGGCSGCVTAASQQVTVTAAAAAGITAAGPTTFCLPGSVTLSASSGTTYSWSPGGQTTSSISATASGSYTVTITDGNCTATSAATVVTGNLAPTASFTFTQNDPTVNFSGSATGGTPSYSYAWDFDDGNLGSGSTTSHTYLTPGFYNVILCVSDNNGCEDCDQHGVTLLPIGIDDHAALSDLNIYPNPANDVINILFSMGTLSMMEVKLVNSSGQLVFNEKLEQFSGNYNRQVNVSSFVAGNYLLEIVSEAGKINRKIIVK